MEDRSAGDVKDPVRVIHVSPATGGVATAARRLDAGLVTLGVDSQLIARGPGQTWPGQPQGGAGRRLLAYSDSALRRVNEKLGLTGLTNISSLFAKFQADVVHFHGMDSDEFNLYRLKALDRAHALVWTMHDKHLGTGACGYPEMWSDCDHWQRGCGACAKVKAHRWAADLTPLVYRRKKSIIESTRLALVAPSRWMFEFISENPITRSQPRRLIPYGVDTALFSPQARGASREALGWADGSRYLLLVASNLDQPRKGFQYVLDLIRELKTRPFFGSLNLSLALVGNPPGAEAIAALEKLIPIVVLGQVQSQARLAQVYSASDAFLIPSMIDNFPSVVLESMACATPVAGFAVGGIRDMVVPGETGLLSGLGDVITLARELSELLLDPGALKRMGGNARLRVEQYYRLDQQAAAYRQLYRELLGGPSVEETVPEAQAVS